MRPFHKSTSPALRLQRSWTALLAIASLAACGAVEPDDLDPGDEGARALEQGVQPLSVQGNKVLAGGQPASFAGNSLFWSNRGWGGEKYYTANTVAWLKRDWRSSIVRAAMGVEDGGGYRSDPAGNKARVKTVVDAAIANDMYVIIDWHSHHAEQYQSEAEAFFREMAQTYGHRPHVIYEIYNEPLQISWRDKIKPYAEGVIRAIRAVDPDNLIIVGTPQWSQRVDEASRDRINANNIAYTLHFYAGSHGQYLRDWASTALNNGAALFVTEWGSVNASGDGAVNAAETNAWVDFMKRNNLSHANWALNDKPEGASALIPGTSPNGNWGAGQLTPSGALAKSIISSWSAPPQNSVTVQGEDYLVMSGVQLEGTSDEGGGRNVGYIDAGDWMSYPSVNLAGAGTYTVEYRVASLSGGGALRLEEAGGSPLYGIISIPATGGWQRWQTIQHTVSLPAGARRFGINATSGGWNLNWFRVTKTN